ncbi:MAG: HAD family phosphatase [Spirochaetales bacterium]|nr:HAD family phosphatase [Spirochaetales bacterium]
MNIVFDLGGVLFKWEPHRLMAKHFPDDKEAALVDLHLHSHPDWAELDRGTLNHGEAARRGAERSGLDEGRILRFLEEAMKSLTPREETVELLRQIKKTGQPLYLLSNMHSEAVPLLEKYPFMSLFDGKIYSCRVHQVKPKREIYQTLLNTFSLAAEETVFIDDSPVNLPQAKGVGIRTIHFVGADSCRDSLKHLGAL